jgi:hypothetical protein
LISIFATGAAECGGAHFPFASRSFFVKQKGLSETVTAPAGYRASDSMRHRRSSPVSQIRSAHSPRLAQRLRSLRLQARADGSGPLDQGRKPDPAFPHHATFAATGTLIGLRAPADAA